MFNEFPYTDLHNLNLDWFLEQFKTLKTLVNNMESMLTALQSLPDASGASDGQVLTADGTGGWQWEDPQSGGGADIPDSVKQAIANLLLDAVYNSPDHSADKAVIQAWASSIDSVTLSANSGSAVIGNTITITASTTGTGTLQAVSSDTGVATVAVNGSTITITAVTAGSATITVTYGTASATYSATVTAQPATLVSISAVYTQGDTVIYDTDSLDDLKPDLVVTASYDDSTTATIASSDYTLSGTLTVGTSTITVSYGGQTTTFNVTVTGYVGLLYDWDFTNSLIDSVSANTAVTTATQDSNGLTFSSTSLYAEFPAVYGYGRTYEIDVDSMSLSLSNSRRYARLWMVDSDSDTSAGGSGYIISTTYKSGDLFYINGAWESNVIISSAVDSQGTYYTGKTVGFYVNNSGIVSVYIDGVLMGSSAAAMPAPNGQNVYIGSSGSSVDFLNTSVFTGFRVYAGNKYS